MKFTVETKKDLTIFKLQESRLDATVAPELKSEFIVLIEAEGKRYLIIDLSQVEVIDSSGIGAMLVAHRQTADHDGFAAFVGIRNRVRDLLRMTGLDKQLYIFSSIQEAISSIETVDSDEDEEEDIPVTKRSRKTVDADDEDELGDDLLNDIPEIGDDMSFGDLETSEPEVEEPEYKDDRDVDEEGDEDEDDDEKPSKRKGKVKGKAKGGAEKKDAKKAKTTKKKSK